MQNTLQQFNIKNRRCTVKTVKSVVDTSTLFFSTFVLINRHLLAEFCDTNEKHEH